MAVNGSPYEPGHRVAPTEWFAKVAKKLRRRARAQFNEQVNQQGVES